jgi:hypothetical protein
MTARRHSRGTFNMTAWLKVRRAQADYALDQPSELRDTTAPRSVTGLAPKQHDPETARLIAEWDAKQKRG